MTFNDEQLARIERVTLSVLRYSFDHRLYVLEFVRTKRRIDRSFFQFSPTGDICICTYMLNTRRRVASRRVPFRCRTVTNLAMIYSRPERLLRGDPLESSKLVLRDNLFLCHAREVEKIPPGYRPGVTRSFTRPRYFGNKTRVPSGDPHVRVCSSRKCAVWWFTHVAGIDCR